jgi:hypothetical protein
MGIPAGPSATQRFAVAHIADFLQVCHYVGKDAVVRPEPEYFLDWRVDVDGFIYLDRLRPVTDADNVAELVVETRHGLATQFLPGY